MISKTVFGNHLRAGVHESLVEEYSGLKGANWLTHWGYVLYSFKKLNVTKITQMTFKLCQNGRFILYDCKGYGTLDNKGCSALGILTL